MNGPSDPHRADAELLGRLLDEQGPALALYAAQWTDTAEDCVQEALVELARQPVVPPNLRAWLFRVVKNRALNVARQSRRRREREGRAVELRRNLPNAAGGADRLDAMDVAEALDRLDGRAREIVVMRIWGALTYEEIAAALSVSISTVHRHYFQALANLRPLLESSCPTNIDSRENVIGSPSPNETHCRKS